MAGPLSAAMLAETWAMEPSRLNQFIAEIDALPPEAEARTAGLVAPDQGQPFAARDGVAHIAIDGPILKSVPWILRAFGVRATSTEDTRRALFEALASDDVRSIVLDVDSPGGTVTGVHELAEVIRSARDVKPVAAHIDGQGASAAYWLAAQASPVTATRSSMIGSIGVLTTLTDSSKAAADAGLKVHVVASHPLKGAGTPGAQVSAAQVADAQRVVDGFADLFVGDVADGRGMPADKARALATGQVWLGADAVANGLVDSVTTAEQAHASAAGAGSISVPVAASASGEQAPTAGALEDVMVQDNNAAAAAAALAESAKLLERAKHLEAELASKNAEIAAKDAALASAVVAQRKGVLDKYADRIAPAMVASVAQFADSCGADLSRLEAFLASLPVAARPTPAGGAPEVSAVGKQITADEKDIADLFGINAKRWAKLQTVAYVDASTGQPYDKSHNPVEVN